MLFSGQQRVLTPFLSRYHIKNTEMVRAIKLMAEYGGTVLWELGDGSGPINIDSLPLPTELKDALKQWARTFDETLNEEYPPDSGFETQAAEAAFEIEGQRLWKAISLELGSEYELSYYSWSEGKLLPDK